MVMTRLTSPFSDPGPGAPFGMVGAVVDGRAVGVVGAEILVFDGRVNRRVRGYVGRVIGRSGLRGVVGVGVNLLFGSGIVGAVGRRVVEGRGTRDIVGRDVGVVRDIRRRSGRL